MAANHPLQGAELISCAQASAKQGIADAARACGYGNDLSAFEANLKQACEDANIHIETLGDLVNPAEVQAMQKRRTT